MDNLHRTVQRLVCVRHLNRILGSTGCECVLLGRRNLDYDCRNPVWLANPLGSPWCGWSGLSRGRWSVCTSGACRCDDGGWGGTTCSATPDAPANPVSRWSVSYYLAVGCRDRSVLACRFAEQGCHGSCYCEYDRVSGNALTTWRTRRS